MPGKSGHDDSETNQGDHYHERSNNEDTDYNSDNYEDNDPDNSGNKDDDDGDDDTYTYRESGWLHLTSIFISRIQDHF